MVFVHKIISEICGTITKTPNISFGYLLCCKVVLLY